MDEAPLHPPIRCWAQMPFAERLTALRKASGLTQQALAQRAGLHATLLRRYETGKVQPSLDALRRLAIALSVSADVLLFDPSEREPGDDLRLHFEALARLSPDERQLVKSVIESVVLTHDVRRSGLAPTGTEAR